METAARYRLICNVETLPIRTAYKLDGEPGPPYLANSTSLPRQPLAFPLSAKKQQRLRKARDL